MRATTAGICLFLVSGCATITTGQNQPLSVNTSGCQAATCELRNDKGTFYVASTPGSVTVQRAYGDMTVTCEKGEYKSNPYIVASTTKAMAFGNILIGGLIGAAVDAGTGSAYDYPALINVPMICSGDPKTVAQPTAPSIPGASSATAAIPAASVQPAIPTATPSPVAIPVSASASETSPKVPTALAPPTSRGAVLPPGGSKHLYAAEQFAKGVGCQTPVGTLNVQTATYEIFTMTCSNGDPLSIRCDGSSCHELK